VTRALVLFSVGLFALVLQGVLAGIVGYPLCPDLGLLVVVAIGLHWDRLSSGFALATCLGYATDVLSGSLLGQHALLRLFSFAAATFGSRQLNLRGAVPLAIFAGGLTLAYGLALHGLGGFFTAGSALPASAFGRMLAHAAVNSLFAPLVSHGVGWLCAVAGEDDGRRGMRLRAGTAD
jgi:rod shape-determining protein MreD